MRIILHVDMDAFYAAIEQRDHPELRGKPVIVGGSKHRGVVSTASYEARPFGVHSAMPMAKAMRLCPQAIVVPVRMSHYEAVSECLMSVLRSFTPLLEPLSLDEAFLDMTGCVPLFGTPQQMALHIQRDVREATQLTCSVGVGSNKFLAKLASDLDKPDGVTLVPFGRESQFIAPLPVRKLWGVGPKAGAQLEELGLKRIGQVAGADTAWLRSRLGASFADHLQALARAEDDRPVVVDRDRKSVGSEETLDTDVRGIAAVGPLVRVHCERVAERLRAAELHAGGVRVKIRYSRTFQLISREAQMPAACDDSRTIWNAASKLLDKLDLEQPIRLVGVAATSLCDMPVQQGLFDDGGVKRNSRLEHTIDSIRARFGDVIRRPRN